MYLTVPDFALANVNRVGHGKHAYATPHNAAAGALRKHDPSAAPTVSTRGRATRLTGSVAGRCRIFRLAVDGEWAGNDGGALSARPREVWGNQPTERQDETEPRERVLGTDHPNTLTARDTLVPWRGRTEDDEITSYQSSRSTNTRRSGSHMVVGDAGRDRVVEHRAHCGAARPRRRHQQCWNTYAPLVGATSLRSRSVVVAGRSESRHTSAKVPRRLSVYSTSITWSPYTPLYEEHSV